MPKVGRSATTGPAGGALPKTSEERMQHQLDVVTKMMTFLMDGKKDASDGSMEQVHPGTTSLATLVEPGDTAPIDFADWLTVIEPAMQDLSDSSYAWWEKVMTEATTWYQDYVKLRPLQRSMFEASPSSELRKTKWVRVERRAVTMMMSAVPASIKDELVATKSLSPLKIITKLMTIYQPGGLQEKSVKQLEDPGEAAGTSAAVAQLRKWLRWMRRAEDVNLSLPDASILMRGLTRQMKKVLTLWTPVMETPRLVILQVMAPLTRSPLLASIVRQEKPAWLELLQGSSSLWTPLAAAILPTTLSTIVVAVHGPHLRLLWHRRRLMKVHRSQC